jgi:hypothetical protein
MQGQLSPKLLVLVHQVFDLLDSRGVDYIEPPTLIAHFDASRHPEVSTRARTAEQVQKEFLDTFDVGGVEPGRITREEFVKYYTNIAATVNDDSYLELVLRKVWHLGEPVTNADVAAYKAHLTGGGGGGGRGGSAAGTNSLANRLREAQTLDSATAARGNSALGMV